MNANAGNDMGAASVGAGRSGASAGFSIVVAMDRNRGIGKGGGLPWPKLKGDMKFFKELTQCPYSDRIEARWDMSVTPQTKVWNFANFQERFLSSSIPSKPLSFSHNVVVMGRLTWNSLPNQHRPLKGRINRILSASESIHMMWQENVFEQIYVEQESVHASTLIDSWECEAYSVNTLEDALAGIGQAGIANIFVIGGGQVYETALKDSKCGYLYITEIDAAFDCDTFFPETPGFKPVLSSPWIEENGIRYRFRRYDRV